jgi:4-hydroxy-2-oxoheptanedioate aldolase
MGVDVFRTAAQQGRLLFNAWTVLGSPYAIEILGAAGWDVLTLDQQHGLGDYDRLVDCLTAARAAGLPALVRVAANEADLIGRALDGGAQGVICPMIYSAEDAESAVRAVKYPPRGRRSWGPYRAQFMSDGDYVAEANDWTVACIQIETASALDRLDDILAIEGLDMVLAGPNDLSMTLLGRADIRAKEVTDALDLICRKAREANVMTAVFANDVDYARPLAKAGWGVLTVGTDGGMLEDAAKGVLAELRPG